MRSITTQSYECLSFVSLAFIFIPLPRRMPICKMPTVLKRDKRHVVARQARCKCKQVSYRYGLRQHEFGCKCKFLHHSKDRPSSSVTSPPFQGHFACSDAISHPAAVRGGLCSDASYAARTRHHVDRVGKGRQMEKKRRKMGEKEGTIHTTVGSRYW